ncbi:VPA1262 family N-terminal domain-containing protein [Methanobrevibacter millerae]|uniref:Uncharacterized protein n=1 Tax=Methanobrevibacter millerae TaxID=230361 RepID=A0A0U3DMY4_9EURY|nr:VPA1262 family N-terminal domain-containing protein [Methanobrevibacter millerae]ALT69318.1 hypothetical protein sm9_1549 [Methanobrevibacter millerae]
MDEYDLLSKKGNVGIYNSCEVTELVVMEPSNKIYNLFTICVFQEKNVTPKKHKYDRFFKRIDIDDCSMGIFQYELTLAEIKENFEKLLHEYKWISNRKGEYSIKDKCLRRLNKQFIPSIEDNRLNYILKNNFYSGSYILEFFDEKKQFEFLTEDEEHFEKVSKKINKILPINLFNVRDRLGNFIFQFPVNILHVKTEIASDSGDSLNFNLDWHHLINDNCPDCILEVDSILDNNYLGTNFEEYCGNGFQEVNVGNVDSLVNVKIWRENPRLLLYSNSGYSIKSIGLSMWIDIQHKRFFMNNNEKEVISLNSKDFDSYISSNSKNSDSSVKNQEYYQYIQNSIGIKEKELLEETLSFKQYTPFKDKSEGIRDLRRLIRENGKNGVYLWDPFLSFNGIVNTLFYCPFEDVALKALGSNKLNNDELINQKNLFSNLNSNFEGLNLEFRIQQSQKAHDRFLIFPGNSEKYEQPKVYSLGTSLNSFGHNYHILQEVSHPRAVVTVFDKIWEKSKGNLIWKYPK